MRMLLRAWLRQKAVPGLLSGLVPAALVLLISPAQAEYRITEKTEYYSIAGGNERELRDQLNQNGHKAADGRSYDANTTTRLRWDFTYRTTSDDCRIGSVLVIVDIRYLLPRWVDEESAPRALRERWNSYVEKLTAHERTHRDLAQQAARHLEAELMSMPARRFCDDVGKAANEQAQGIVKDLQRTEAEYDERTKHGYTEGAMFP